VGTDFVLLDRVRGSFPSAAAVRAAAALRGKLDLPAPVANVDALVVRGQRLVCELAGWLTGRGLGVIEMSLALAHERYVGVAPAERHLVGFRAGRSGARARALDLGAARAAGARRVARAVEGITLASDGSAPLGSRNLGLLPATT
jgi:hypothetical protein